MSSAPPDPARKAQLRAAAVDLFAEHGYAGTSMQMLMDACGVNKALVYYYFGSKEKLFAEILEGFYADFQAVVAKLLEGEGSFRERVMAFLDAYMDLLAANPAFPRIIQREVATRGPGLQQSRQSIGPLLAGGIDLLRQAVPGLAREDDMAALETAMSVYGALIGHFSYGPLLADVTGEDPFSPERIERRKAHLRTLAGLLLDEAERRVPERAG